MAAQNLGAFVRAKAVNTDLRPNEMRRAIAQSAKVSRANVIERAPVDHHRRTESNWSEGGTEHGIFDSEAEDDFDRTASFTQLQTASRSSPLRAPTPQAPPVPRRGSLHPLEAAAQAGPVTPRRHLEPISGSPSASEYEEEQRKAPGPSPEKRMPVRTRNEDLPEPRRQLLENLTSPKRREVPQREQSPTPQSKTSVHESRSPSPAVELDYPEDTLRGLDFAELVEQPFDTIPGPDMFGPQLPDGLKRGTLPDRLSILLKEQENVQRTFFSSLPINEWEDAGDWFLERFGEMMGKIVEARKEKRRIAGILETEIAGREQIVGKRRDGLEHALAEMKQGGMSVLGRSSY